MHGFEPELMSSVNQYRIFQIKSSIDTYFILRVPTTRFRTRLLGVLNIKIGFYIRCHYGYILCNYIAKK